MKKLLLSCALVLSALSAPAPMVAPAAHAQSSVQDAAAQIKQAADWTQQAFDLQTLMTSIFQSEKYAALEVLLMDDAVMANDPNLMSAFRDWRTETQNTIAALRTATAQLPPPPKVAILAGNPMLDSQYAGVKDMADRAATLAARAETSINRAIKGDDAGLADLQMLTNDAISDFIKAENTTIDGSLLGIKPDHPNHHLLSVFKQANLFTIAEMTILNLSFAQGEDLSARTALLPQMKSTMDASRMAIREGRRTSESMQRMMDTFAAKATDPAEKQIMTAVSDMLKSFPQSFDVEDRILSLQQKSYALYSSNRLMSDFEDELATIDAEIITNIDQRGALIDARVQAMSQLQ